MLASPDGGEPISEPPGGYWTVGEQRERAGEPPDGDDELTIGSVLFSLGLLRAAAGAVMVWTAGRPDLCPVAASSCRGYGLFGVAGIGEGGLMFGTGVVYLAIGASRRARYRRWKRGESLARWFAPDGSLAPHVSVVPWWTAGADAGGGVRVQVRF